MPFLTFKVSAATSLMNASATRNKWPGRPSLDRELKKKRTTPPKVALEVHYDGIDHYPMKVETAQASCCHREHL